MEPVNNQDVLIRLLKDGHISSDEFKSLYEDSKETVKIDWKYDPTITVSHPNIPIDYHDFIHLYDPNTGPFYTTN